MRLEQVYRELRFIRARQDDIAQMLSTFASQPTALALNEPDLLLLPDHLRCTYVAVASKGECGANDVHYITGRCRSVESNYLNQLVRMGWLRKLKRSKHTVFQLTKKIK